MQMVQGNKVKFWHISIWCADSESSGGAKRWDGEQDCVSADATRPRQDAVWVSHGPRI